MSREKPAPAFAKKFSQLIEDRLGTSQRGIASKLGIDPGAVNRLCRSGKGSEENICRILKLMRLKRRKILETLADRRAELCEGDAREVWSGFRYAFPNTHEYMDELCPFPLDRACAASYVGISIKKLVQFAKGAGIKHVEDVRKLTPEQLWNLYDALTQHFESEKIKVALLRNVQRNIPPVLHLDIFQQDDASQHVPLTGCTGKVLFGIPHVVFAYYVFDKDGRIDDHHHAGGVEYLYSERRTFSLIYRGKKYPHRLTNDGSVIVLKASGGHSIDLVEGEEGRLFVMRYDPQRRDLKPVTLEEREKRRKRHRKKRAAE